MNCPKCKQSLPDEAKYCMFCGKKVAGAPRKHHRRENRTGTIYKMPGTRAKPWAVQLNRVFIGSYATKTEAEEALTRFAGQRVTDRYNFTFADCYDRWAPEHTIQLESRAISRGATDSDTTGMQGYAHSYAYCEPIKDRKLRSITVEDLQQIITGMESLGRSESTQSKVKQLMSQVYKWGMREGIVTQNLATYVIIKPQAKQESDVFTHDEIEKLLHSANPAADVAIILLSTGARIGELFKLPVSDCYDDYFVGGSKTKAGQSRVIPVASFGLESYRRLLSRARADGSTLLIDAYSGNRDPSNFRKRDYTRLLQELEIPYKTPHKARHTYTSIAVQSGVAPEDLTKILGHASYTTTIDKYDHRNTDELIAAAGKIRLDPSEGIRKK